MSSRRKTSQTGFSATAVRRSLWSELSARPRLLNLTDLLIGILLLLLPFVMGGREAWGQWLLISTAFLLGTVWHLHRVFEGGRLRLLALEPLLAAGLLLVWLQSRELPADVLSRLSSGYQRLIPVWNEVQAVTADSSATWSTASFIPGETRHGFLILLAYGLFGVVLAQRLRTEQDCRLVLQAVGVSGLLMSGFAILQLVTSNDCFFWFYRHPFTGTREVLKGAFTNRNHFAQFAALSIGPLLWWAIAARKPKEAAEVLQRKGLGPARGNHSQFDQLVDPLLLLRLAGAAGVFAAIMLSLSRGGMIAAATASAVTFAGLWKAGRISSGLALSTVALAAVALGGLALFGGQTLETRVSDIASLDAATLDPANARRSIWKADLAALSEFPILGTGIGSHRHIYPAYMEDLADFMTFTFSHAESSWIHLGLEAGLAGVALLAAGLLLIVGRQLLAVMRGSDAARTTAIAACLAGISGGILHAVADFVWYVPAIVVTTIALAVTGLRLCDGFSSEAGVPVPRAAWLMLAGGCCALLVLVQPDLGNRIAGEHWWHQYLLASFEASRSGGSSMSESGEPLPDLDGLDQQEEGEYPAAGGAGNGGLLVDTAADTNLLESGGSASDGDMSAFQEPSDNPFSDATETADDTKNSTVDGSGELSDYDAMVTTAGQPTLQQRIAVCRRRLAFLLKAQDACPDQVDVCQNIARRSLELFELQQQVSDNPMPLAQIRDACVNAGFQTKAELREFLQRACGENERLIVLADTMARRALRSCPLQIDPWKTLVLTSFIHDPKDALHARIMAQTMRLGKYNPTVRFFIGQALALDGRAEEALAQWNTVFHSTKAMRLQMLQLLADRLSADALLVSFSPDLLELEDVYDVYGQKNRPNDMQRLMQAISEQSTALAVESGQPVEGYEKYVPVLMKANRIAWNLKQYTVSQTLLRRAIACDTAAESPRRALGLLLMERQQYEDAEKLFEWCYEQTPGDVRLEELRRECRRLKTQQRRLRTAAAEKPAVAEPLTEGSSATP